MQFLILSPDDCESLILNCVLNFWNRMSINELFLSQFHTYSLTSSHSLSLFHTHLFSFTIFLPTSAHFTISFSHSHSFFLSLTLSLPCPSSPVTTCDLTVADLAVELVPTYYQQYRCSDLKSNLAANSKKFRGWKYLLGRYRTWSYLQLTIRIHVY